MRIADPYVDELTSEASTTKRVLERVPEAHLNWRPHEKSMSLGQLALHVATLPRQLTEFVTGDALDFGAAAGAPPTVNSHRELLAAFASSTEQAQSYLSTLSDERARATWRLMAGKRELFASPRAAVLRSFLFNHWYHHRGAARVPATPQRTGAIGVRTDRRREPVCGSVMSCCHAADVGPA